MSAGAFVFVQRCSADTAASLLTKEPLFKAEGWSAVVITSITPGRRAAGKQRRPTDGEWAAGEMRGIIKQTNSQAAICIVHVSCASSRLAESQTEASPGWNLDPPDLNEHFTQI